jgi:hypothetical protein
MIEDPRRCVVTAKLSKRIPQTDRDDPPSVRKVRSDAITSANTDVPNLFLVVESTSCWSVARRSLGLGHICQVHDQMINFACKHLKP